MVIRYLRDFKKPKKHGTIIDPVAIASGKMRCFFDCPEIICPIRTAKR